MSFVVSNALRGFALAGGLVVCACGSSGTSAPTQPSPAPAPPAPVLPVVVHDTLQPNESRTSTRLYPSSSTNAGLLFITDDFVSTATVQARTLRWQGGYCDPRFQVPLAAPRPVARSFRIVIAEDNGNGTGPLTVPPGPLLEFTLTAAEAREELLFDVAENREDPCGPKIPASFSYYHYTATLPRTVALTAGRRYWVSVMADVADSGITWGWRRGTPDNNYAVQSVVSAFWQADMAFSISS
jgi:hypothetical protein